MVQLFSIVSKHRGVDFHHPHSEKIGHPKGIDVYLALFIKTNAIFYINDKFHQVRPNSIVIFSPGTSFSYHNPEGDCINDYFRFDVRIQIFLKNCGSFFEFFMCCT
ncbi:hypothetical protein ACNNMU_06875 [Aerococcus viridans]